MKKINSLILSLLLISCYSTSAYARSALLNFDTVIEIESADDTEKTIWCSDCGAFVSEENHPFHKGNEGPVNSSTDNINSHTFKTVKDIINAGNKSIKEK